ncbi:FtsW/RodA/SpoVE family cell cycle protein [Radiobacillus deserti]|uniref:FtsW/RodA/SpoVE family cell cycle protein n=1 Tax=Radiobacillus deserti TaxID=2594883 RepID=A0A516KI93_9BACI|nr:FtsW/RodA/SpoVE family cell cycle protein [Radiobacillus deserti]QDP41117.1 hypothetical protein FN924_13505 [Radiobacillus deserti]
MNNQRENFIKSVAGYIKAKSARVFVEKELEHHLTEEQKRLVQDGMTEQEAEEQAVKQMGSPVQLGLQLNKVHRPKTDWVIIGLLFLTFCFSFLPILSQPFGSFYVVKQGIYIGMLFIMFLDYTKLAKFAPSFYILGIIYLVLLLFTPHTINGLPYLRVLHFSISTVHSILFFYLSMSVFLSKRIKKPVSIALLAAIPLMFFTIIGDRATSMIYTIMILSIIWLGNSAMSKKVKTFVGFPTVVVATFSMFVNKNFFMQFFQQPNISMTDQYMYKLIDDILKGTHWFGNGIGEAWSIPSSHTDFAFLSIMYQYGWIVAGLIVVTLSVILYRLVKIKNLIRDSFGRLLVVGGISIFASKILYNLGMNLGLLPFIGISLPLISYGPLSNSFDCFVLGLVLSVFRRKDIVVKTTYKES